ncbi:hypothetical protein CTAYLR_000923 [Chrysophaeum taylorii]|uniref:Fibronectin type-III domain-containing protein n=1 Tax=Chrysophaeum taylorii TaxID=2483200 RepID=A0AAD7XJF0_9STRA|nr:hypothetical protein CTAYLR_000923 [Chrysophaeum taylorii]
MAPAATAAARLVLFFGSAAAAAAHWSEVVYEFEDDLEGWAAATSSEMRMEVSASGGGALRGSIHGQNAAGFVDSPVLDLSASGRQSVVMRLKYQGATARVARWRARYGAFAPEEPDAGRADWAPRVLTPVNASALIDGDASTYEVERDFVVDTGGGHAVTELELTGGPRGTSAAGVEGGPPEGMTLQAGPTAAGPWRDISMSSTTNLSFGSRNNIVGVKTGLKEEDTSYYYRVALNASGEARLAEVRALPAVLESRFGISPGPDYQTYVVPLWRRARRAGLQWSDRGAIKLTRLRLYLGDPASAPAEMREYDASATAACEDWKNPSLSASWASRKWRLVPTYARTGPWIVTELRVYEDAACTAALEPPRDVLASSSSSSGDMVVKPGVLQDGECPNVEASGSDASRAWTGDADDAWLGLEFYNEVAVRCVAVCHGANEDDRAGRATSVTLQRWEDGSWIDHATLPSLDARATLAVANPCTLRYVPPSAPRARRLAYDRSARDAGGGFPVHGSALAGDGFEIDWIRVTRPPLVRSVTGCVDKFWPDLEDTLAAERLDLDEDDAVTAQRDAFFLENGFLRRGLANAASIASTYATTYNCPRAGGLRIAIRGERLGSWSSRARVAIGGSWCLDVGYESDGTLTCTLPAAGTTAATAEVRVERADIPELYDAVPYLAYAVAPDKMAPPTASNVAARSVDLTWTPSGGLWGALAITGYVVSWRKAPSYTETTTTTTLGNVTTTTVIGLEPKTRYAFAVAAVVENRWADPEAVDAVDLYGRRRLLDDALVGTRSTFTAEIGTLEHDFAATAFDANATLSHGPVDDRKTVGPSGVVGGEGHYGFVLVGAANVENCNLSHACCDGLENGACPNVTVSCAQQLPSPHQQRPPRNDPTLREDLRAEKRFGSKAAENLSLVLQPCGPSIRLTGSTARQAGAAWYSRRVNVREGFDTSFVLRAANPSVRCDRMDETYTRCVSRGGDGFAFVVQENRYDALGAEGAGLGYDGLNNSLAVEFDTFYNYELGEPYHNHVSVQSRGWRYPNTAHHDASFAATARIPDIATRAGRDRELFTARVVYTPYFEPSLLQTDAFVSSPHAARFFTNADFPNGGMADFGIGLGTLSVYVDDLPVIITPLNLDALLALHHGRAYVGLTAATGLETWQAHDVLQWNFTSLRRDPRHVMPPVVSAATAFSCVDPSSCVHA